MVSLFLFRCLFCRCQSILKKKKAPRISGSASRSNVTDDVSPGTFIDCSIAPSKGARADKTRTPGTCDEKHPPPALGSFSNGSFPKKKRVSPAQTVFETWFVGALKLKWYIPLRLESRSWRRTQDIRWALWTLFELAFVLAVDHFFSWFAGRLVQKCVYCCSHLKMLLHEKKESA